GDALAQGKPGELLVLLAPALALGDVLDARRAALEQQGADARRVAQREAEREPPAHGIAGQEERLPWERRAKILERVVPAGGRRTLPVPRQVGDDAAEAATQRVPEVIEVAARSSEPVQENERGALTPAGHGEPHGASSALATSRCSSRWRSTFAERSVRTSIICSPFPRPSRTQPRSSPAVRGRERRARPPAAPARPGPARGGGGHTHTA